LSILGDVVLDKSYAVNVPLQEFIFNLEHPLSCEGVPVKNKVNICAEKSYIKETFGKLPLAVNLANNHIADYGDGAFKKTINFLETNNIAYFGAGNEENNYNNPAIVHFNDKRIALLGYSCSSTNAVFGKKIFNGSALLENDRVFKDIEKCQGKVDFIVVNLHWGDEDIRYPKPEDVKNARGIIDAGADLIVGHHAHVIQSFENYKNKYIFYGLGHFLFAYKDRPAYYDGEKFQSVFSPVEKQANREGLVVEFDEDFNISYSTIVFDGEGVKPCKANIPRWLPKTQKQYNLYIRFLEKRKLIELFIRKPRVPQLKHLKYFFGLK
jgi:poly-gamma-glutamate synthesis protein (capsule biosynthesis protein)